MKLALVKIGNSQGIRIPKAVIEQCGFEGEVAIEVKGKVMMVKSAGRSRTGWAIEPGPEDAEYKGEWEW